jgi:hypothetical protein
MQNIVIKLPDGAERTVQARIAEGGTFAYHKLGGLWTLTHIPSGTPIWRQSAPFAWQALARELCAVPQSDWNMVDMAQIANTPFAYNVYMLILRWVQSGKLRGRLVKRGAAG